MPVNYTNSLMRWYAAAVVPDPAAIAADAVALAELPGGTGHEQVRIDWLQRRLERAPGVRSADKVGNLVWTFGPAPYRLAVLVHVDDVFDEATPRGVTQCDGWLCGPGIGDNAIAVATAVAVAERTFAGAGPQPAAVVFTVGEEGLGGLRGAHYACRELAPEAVLALEGHGCDRVFTDAVGSLRVRFTVTGPGGHSWWDRGRPSAVHELVRLLDGMIASADPRLPVNVGLVDGGTGVNAIAARASATVEWRATDQAALDRQEAALASLDVDPMAAGLRLSAERLDRRAAGSLPATHPLVAAVLRARASIGLPATTADGSTDANAALAAGIPALALGCCEGENMHAQSERIRADSIRTGAEQLHAVLAELLDLTRD